MLITLFTPKSPTISIFEFDAVLEDTFEAGVELTEYTIEAGANVSDHRIITPRRWSMIGMMSNNPLKVAVTDFAGGVLSNLVDDSGLAATVAGVSAGILAGSDQSRSSAALNTIVEQMVSGAVVTIEAGDINLQNMVIKDIRRTKTPQNENGLELEILFQELPTLDRVTAILTQPKQDQLRDGDPAKSQISAKLEKGQSALLALTVSQSASIAEFLT